MLQVTNDDKDDSKAVIEQEKEKKSDKPEEATKAEPKIVGEYEDAGGCPSVCGLVLPVIHLPP